MLHIFGNSFHLIQSKRIRFWTLCALYLCFEWILSSARTLKLQTPQSHIYYNYNMLIISLVERLKQLLFLSVVIITLFLVSLTYGQEYGKHNYITNEVQLPYRVLLPEGYEKNSQKMYPLIIFTRNW